MISARLALSTAIALSALPACSPSPMGSGSGPVSPTGGPEIRWNVDKSGKAVVSVAGLDRGRLDALRAARWTDDRLAEVLIVEVKRTGASKSVPPRMLGNYKIDPTVIQFRPRYPLDADIPYRAVFHANLLPGDKRGSDAPISSDYLRTTPPSPPTVVDHVDPGGAVLPENLLKFYVHFSGPMERGSAYEHVQILDNAGKPVDLPFLELGEELWDRSMTRITLLLDPGRIKRGLKPREESGPILESGHSYTLVIDAAWPDAKGRPLAGPFRREFRAGPADESQPDPKSWTIETPGPGTTGPIVVKFGERLDRAMLDRAIRLTDARGKRASGRASIDAEGTTWKFIPGHTWNGGEFRLVVDPELEDLAGNSIRRPFEIDATRPISDRPESSMLSIPIRIGPKP